MRGDRRPAKGTGSFTCRSLSEGWALAADCAALVGQRLTARARERAASATVTSIERGLTQSPTTWTSRPRPRAAATMSSTITGSVRSTRSSRHRLMPGACPLNATYLTIVDER